MNKKQLTAEFVGLQQHVFEKTEELRRLTEKVEHLEGRANTHKTRLDAQGDEVFTVANPRLDELEASVRGYKKWLESHDTRLDAQADELFRTANPRLDSLEERQEWRNKTIREHEERLDLHKQRLDRLNAKLEPINTVSTNESPHPIRLGGSSLGNYVEEKKDIDVYATREELEVARVMLARSTAADFGKSIERALDDGRAITLHIPPHYEESKESKGRVHVQHHQLTKLLKEPSYTPMGTSLQQELQTLLLDRLEEFDQLIIEVRKAGEPE